MKFRSILALGGALLALALLGAGPALAAGSTKVTVRVEGLTRTLLETRTVHVSSTAASITRGGTPSGACPGTSAAGALDAATHGRWDGTYSSYGLEVTQILGETHRFSSRDYWSIWVGGRFAPAGACGLKLHPGEQLLFAAIPQKGSTYPLELSAPRHATAGRSFRVRLYYYNGHDRATPLAGAHVRGISGTTGRQGYITVTPASAGRLVLSASARGYIRSARVTVDVGVG